MQMIKAAQSAYDGAGQGRRLIGWNPGGSGPKRAIEGSQNTLRRRTRDAVRNEPLAASIVRSWLSGLCGSGFTARTQSPDQAIRERIDTLWRDWLPHADIAAEVGDFNGIQAQACRAFIEGGECFIRLRPQALDDGLPVPLQIQVLESEMLPGWDFVAANGNRVIQGVEFNASGRRVAYHFYKNHPGDGDGDNSTLRIAAEMVSHVYLPERPGQIRGVSVLTPILTTLKNLGDFVDATAERAKLANLTVGFLVKPPFIATEGAIDPLTGFRSLAQFDPLTGQPIVTDNSDVPMAALEPGTMQELLPGETVTFNDPPGPGADFSEFVRNQISLIASGAGGMPAEFLTGDLRDVSDRSLRVSLNEWRRTCEAVQWNLIVPKICTFVRNAWVDAALFGGMLESKDYAVAKRCEWTPPRHRHLHPTQDVQGLMLEIDAGLRSRSEVVGEYGLDALQVDAERATDQAREIALGLVANAPQIAEAELLKLQREAEAARQQGDAAEAARREAETSKARIEVERATACAVQSATVAKAKAEAEAAKLDLDAARLALAELQCDPQSLTPLAEVNRGQP